MKEYVVRERLHDNLLEHLMLARGVAPEGFADFLEPDYVAHSHDPFLLPGMEAAVGRIIAAIKGSEPVCVWSDYDADGVPGGVMLAGFLREMGLSVRHYIPHRHKEGYGLNIEGLEELASAGTKLVITCDLGTTEVEQIAYANSRGMDVIVTDHHLEPAVLPDALAIINPKLKASRYPFDGLCGAGVAWKLVQGVLSRYRPETFAEGREKWYLDLVGIGTLSDMVPLVGENRMLGAFGLRVMRRGRRPGLAALLKLLRIQPRTLTEDDIGFMVSPRINAASRMDSPEAAARLLATESSEEAGALALALNKINDERKALVATTVKEANKRLALGGAESPVIVIGSPSWRPGILGLVANSLVEAHRKPAFVWGREGGELLRGSCRSDGVANVVELMHAAQAAAGVFDHCGGHAASGGFALEESRAHELPGALSRAYQAMEKEGASAKEVVVDRELDLSELLRTLGHLDRLAPFGIGNQKPLFIFPNATVGSIKTFGKQKNHLQISIADEFTRADGIAFFSTPGSFAKTPVTGGRADVVGHVERDWRGSPRVRIVDIL